MYSRAHVIIEQDYNKLKSNNLWGIEARPIHADNVFEWSATVLGEMGSIWEGGIFRLYLKFDEFYNDHPPTVCFHTIPFHANVDPITGRPAIDFLDDFDLWNVSYDITYVLLSIQSLLSKPNLENVVNGEAADAMLYRPDVYQKTVSQCVTASQKLSDLVVRDQRAKIQRTVAATRTASANERTRKTAWKQIAFEDYHDTWSTIGTSKAKTGPKDIRSNVRLGSTHRQLSSATDNNNNKSNTLSKLSVKMSPKRKREMELDRMRKMYMQQVILSETKQEKQNNLLHNSLTLINRRRVQKEEETEEEAEGEAEPADHEVDSLVDWTDHLDLECL